jgi:protein phosphatase
MTVESYGLTDPGSVRTENQDRILLEPALGLFAVCDGMGGHRHGGLAAEIAVSAIQHFLMASQDNLDVTWPFGYNFAWSVDANRLVTSIKLANRMVCRRAGEAVEHAGMGTTVAAALVQPEQAVVANVGDSRVYRMRSNMLAQLSTDDTMVASLAQQGLLSSQELNNHPMRNILTQAAGSQEEVDVHLWEDLAETGDRFLLCSDGLYGVVSDDAIRQALECDDPLEVCARRLLDAAIQGGSPDNVAVVLLRYSE